MSPKIKEKPVQEHVQVGVHGAGVPGISVHKHDFSPAVNNLHFHAN
jgi:hypothetical protein